MGRGRQPRVSKAQESWHKHIPQSGSLGSHVTLDRISCKQLEKEVLQSRRWSSRKLTAKRCLGQLFLLERLDVCLGSH